MRRFAVLAFSAWMLLAGCATLKNTPQQDYVWAVIHACELSVPAQSYFTKVDANGQWHATCSQISSGWGQFTDCARDWKLAHPYREWIEQHPDKLIGEVKLDPVAEAALPWTPGDEWSYRWSSPRGSGTFVWSVDREEVLDGVPFYVVKSGTTRESYYRKGDRALFMSKINGQVESRYIRQSRTSPPHPGQRKCTTRRSGRLIAGRSRWRSPARRPRSR
jgi:hypothetical protein